MDKLRNKFLRWIQQDSPNKPQIDAILKEIKIVQLNPVFEVVYSEELSGSRIQSIGQRHEEYYQYLEEEFDLSSLKNGRNTLQDL